MKCSDVVEACLCTLSTSTASIHPPIPTFDRFILEIFLNFLGNRFSIKIIYNLSGGMWHKFCNMSLHSDYISMIDLTEEEEKLLGADDSESEDLPTISFNVRLVG